MIAALIIGSPLFLFALLAAVADHFADPDGDEDEDLQWVEHRIALVENIEPINEDAAQQQREYLDRLRRIRRELLREGR